MAEAFVADKQVLDGICDLLNDEFNFSDFGIKFFDIKNSFSEDLIDS